MTKKIKVNTPEGTEERTFTERQVGKAHIWNPITRTHKEPQPIIMQVPDHDPDKEAVLYPLGEYPRIVGVA